MKITYLYRPFKNSDAMQIRTSDIELKYLADYNKEQLKPIFTSFISEYGGHFAGAAVGNSAGELMEYFEAHRVEHGISIGGLYINNNTMVGIGGFHYLEDTGLYEIVCTVLPQFEDNLATALNHLVLQAFDSLMMDKLCARAVPASAMDTCLANSGFAFSGERVFMKGVDGQIWNYYELEDETNLVSAESTGTYTDNDWDALF